MRKYLLWFVLVIFIFSCGKEEDKPFNSDGEYDGKPCPGTETITYMGKTYQTIQIGPQCWMAENLNVGVMVNGLNDMLDNDTIEKYCYDDDTTNCGIYGGLYQWDELMNYTTERYNNQGICPDGWHIPAVYEWYDLENYLGGQDVSGGKMKEVGFTHWEEPNEGATNVSGFTALPGGFRRHVISTNEIEFLDLGKSSSFWTSVLWDEDRARSQGYNYLSANGSGGAPSKKMGYSVRCIKN